MTIWSPTFSFLLLFPLIIFSSVESLTVTSSSQVDRNFTCNEAADAFPPPCEYKKKKLYIQGFFPANNEVFESELVIPAAYAAIDDVNAKCDLLRNYSLQLDFVNTRCDVSEATWQLIDSIVQQKNNPEQPKIAFLGGGCSLATEPIAALAGRFYIIPMISYGASSPSLSSCNLFPRFTRTIPSENQANTARFALMYRYNWTKVATLHETQTIFSLAVEDFHNRYDYIYNTSSKSEDELEEEEDLILRSFTDDPEIPLTQIKEKDIRIIFGYFYEKKAVTTLCQAIRMNLTTKNHLWMFPAWFTEGWWNVNYTSLRFNCTAKEMKKAVLNSFFLGSHLYGTNKSVITDTKTLTAEDFDKKYNCYLREFRANPNTMNLTNDKAKPHIYRTFTYDAIWTIARGLDKTDRELEEMGTLDSNFTDTLDDYTYFDNNSLSISKMISENMRETSFIGVSGQVSFGVNGNRRRGLNAIYQLVQSNSSDDLDLVLLAVHSPTFENDTTYNNGTFNRNLTFMRKPVFKGGSPPRDRRTPKNLYMNQTLVIFFQVLVGIALAVTIGLLIFNIITLYKLLIRDSAPHINTVVLVGCIVMLSTCFLMSVDTANPPVDNRIEDPDEDLEEDMVKRRNSRYATICTLRLWFLSIGFSLSFGALFAKTWQIYRVYTNPKLLKEPFKMWNFLIIMCVFLGFDLIYLTFWTGTFPFSRDREMKTDTSNDVENIHELCKCNNYAYLIGALYVWKGLQVIFGLFLAYESRNVKYHYINDSRFVSIAMYIVVILVGIGAPLSLVLAVHFFTDAAYSLAIFIIIASCLSCSLILFVPKFVFMARGKDTMVQENNREEITVSDGLQLGRSSIDQTEARTVEDEVSQLKNQNAEKELELQKLEGEAVSGSEWKQKRNGSDGDSGVLVTGDDTEVFSTDSTTTGAESHRLAITTPLPEDVQLSDIAEA